MITSESLTNLLTETMDIDFADDEDLRIDLDKSLTESRMICNENVELKGQFILDTCVRTHAFADSRQLCIVIHGMRAALVG